ncbi:hypothetical protein BHE90_016800 [Fusarium euwallaceae]|uniref:Uncharacterized protein n=1 Tax=Fusarium euwallaceae TaxID=1147111 RepID=A0A430KZD1_9HYPO|nr:hypothetical protein BHE90_016800 [Fusarium euwallaceae]
MVGTQKGPRRYPQSEGRVAEHQRRQVNTLLRQLFSSVYNKGAGNIARLCLLWREYKYYRPSTRQDILSRLDELRSQQNLLQGVGDVSTSSPSRLSYAIGFSDDDDDSDLEKQLGYLNIHENASPVDDELVTIARLRARLSRQTKLLEKLESVATEALSQVQLSIKLQITILSPDRIDLSNGVAELVKDMYRHLDEATGQIMAAPSILAGKEGLVQYEEQPRRSLAQRPDARTIMDSVILKVEILANLAFRCLLLCSGLLAQGRILFSPSQDPNDDAMEALFDIPNDLEDKSASIKSSLDALVILREQPDHSDQLFKVENHTKLPHQDEGVGALYEQVRRQASSRQSPS